MALTAAVLIQLAGLLLLLYLGPWGIVPGGILLLLGGRLYRKEQSQTPAPELRIRALRWGLYTAAAAGFLLVWVNPWNDNTAEAAALTVAAAPRSADDASKPCVFILHGLARFAGSMDPLAVALAEAGFTVSNVAYPSTRGTLATMVAPLASAVAEHGDSCTQMHFAGYSLGAIIIRAYLANTPPPRLGRVVMIAPPNHGSELADVLGAIWLFRTMAGPVAAELGTSVENLPRRLPTPRYPVGVIAGDRIGNPLGQLLIPGAHDGTVSVASTQLEGMTDFLLVHRTHHFILRAPEVVAQTAAFLQRGRFERPPSPAPST